MVDIPVKLGAGSPRTLGSDLDEMVASETDRALKSIQDQFDRLAEVSAGRQSLALPTADPFEVFPGAKRPRSSAWKLVGTFAGSSAEVWRRGRLKVLSSCSSMNLPRGEGKVGPTWHVSVSRNGKARASDAEVELVRKAFDMREAEEDNHHPGVARHLMMPVDPAYRVDCECKADEVQVVEPDGYTWSNRAEGPCRGCELEAMTGRLCSVHADRGRWEGWPANMYQNDPMPEPSFCWGCDLEGAQGIPCSVHKPDAFARYRETHPTDGDR